MGKRINMFIGKRHYVLLAFLNSSLKMMFPTGLVVSVVDPHPGESIVDCCAAPGGKTLFLASRLNGQGNYCEIRT